jgi:hypothetical protein
MNFSSIRTIIFSVSAVSVFCVCAGAQTASVPAVKKDSTPAAAAKVVAKKAVQPASAAKVDAKKADQSVSVADTVAPAVDSLVQLLSGFRVVTVPESAQVYLDDSLRGVAPCTVLNVIPGRYVLALKKVGCYLKKAEITVDSTGQQEFAFTLLQPAFLRVESDPTGAEVSIDGKKTGVTPWENDKVKPGDYTVGVTLATFNPVEKKVAMASARADTVRFSLNHTDAYQDSIASARLAEEKSHRERFHGTLATALFLLGAVIIVLLEMMND